MSAQGHTAGKALQLLEANFSSSGWDSALLRVMSDDAVIEFPFAPQNQPKRIEGKDQITPYFAELKKIIRLDEMHMTATHRSVDPNVVIFQAEGKGVVLATGRPFTQKYIDVLTFRDGLLIHLQDYWNPLTVLLALGASINMPNSILRSDRSTKAEGNNEGLLQG